MFQRDRRRNAETERQLPCKCRLLARAPDFFIKATPVPTQVLMFLATDEHPHRLFFCKSPIFITHALVE
jgi:hypothetical protein